MMQTVAPSNRVHKTIELMSRSDHPDPSGSWQEIAFGGSPGGRCPRITVLTAF
jgi:hypothetical protein